MVTLDLFNVKADGLRGITLASPEGELPRKGSSPCFVCRVRKVCSACGSRAALGERGKTGRVLFADGRKECGKTDSECHSDRKVPVLRDPRVGSRGSQFSPALYQFVPVLYPLCSNSVPDCARLRRSGLPLRIPATASPGGRIRPPNTARQR